MRPYIMGVRDRPRPTKMAVRVEEVALICFLSTQNYCKSGYLSWALSLMLESLEADVK